jgi:ATP-binding cassette, subfamily F, member 1
MGIYNQHFVERLPLNKSAVEYLREHFPEEDYQSIRNRLGKYGLEGHAHEIPMRFVVTTRKMFVSSHEGFSRNVLFCSVARDLSGGQKARAVFVDLSLSAPHILLLDEPTNVRVDGFVVCCASREVAVLHSSSSSHTASFLSC